MHVALVMECDYRQGRTQEEAFSEAFTIAEAAENCGLDGVWLAERHFATHRRPTDPMGAGIPSVVSVPLVWASAIAARSERLRIGTGVSVLPLCHPIRLAEEAATVDQISRGRLDFGVGRSGFARAYEGYGIPYGESRERFQEALDVILKAWTDDRLTYEGKYFRCENLCVMPRPYQQPHPPIRVAATTPDTFPMIGRMGYPLVTGLRGFDIPEVAQNLKRYREAWHAAGHAGNGNVYIRIPVYVAATDVQGQRSPRPAPCVPIGAWPRTLPAPRRAVVRPSQKSAWRGASASAR
ncbi:MAG: LLM class flavin-dependent oxidoreductase [Candidatus Tectomicrobia bacterium]|uniref:LLM class flavin-dependent oxidoreductase n=1 Tax=Tectimicrobiota bacterium TaxID=2528274 RepID=A0A938B4P6_UNCTE|nr:LLM class flavin-dependent oxidoreductase [Candidatus Tectomicrobia bacterium]